MASNQATLISLAILKVDLDEGRRDYLGYFENFVISLIRRHKLDPVTDTDVARIFESDYGLRIPKRAAQLVLRRLARKSYLRREHNTYQIAKELPIIDLSTKRESAQKSIDDVYQALKDYAEQNFQLNWTDEDVDKSIFGFLDRFGIDCLRAYIFRTALPRIRKDDESNLYVVSKFISALHHEKSPLFGSVIVLVKGAMYANSLNCPDLESIEKNFKKVTFYLDAPLVFDLLRINGDERHAATGELVGLLKKLKGTVALFEHTVDEIDTVLEYAENNIESPTAAGRIIYALREAGMKRGDIALLRANLRDDIENDGIRINRTPRFEEDLQVGERELLGQLEGIVKTAGGAKFDVNSIRSIFVLREGQTPKRLEDTSAVLVTDNSSVAEAAFQYGKDHNSAQEVSAVITGYSLANVAWLKAPLGAPELPEKETLAACYAAMEPRTSLWELYLSEVDKLKRSGRISPDDHAALRLSGIAVDELMNMTRGDEGAFGGGTVRNILDRVKESYSAESQECLIEEKNKHAETRDEKERVEKQQHRLTTRLYWISGTVARIAMVLLSLFAMMVLVIAAIASPILTTAWIANSYNLSAMVNFVLTVAVVWGIYSNWVGASVRDVLRSCQRKTHDWMFAKLRSWLHL